MKAIDKLIELRKQDPFIVAIAKDRNGVAYAHKEIPDCQLKYGEWISESFITTVTGSLDFGSTLWTQCIITEKDLESYEVKMMSISVQDYERLVQAEKTLENIKKFLS